MWPDAVLLYVRQVFLDDIHQHILGQRLISELKQVVVLLCFLLIVRIERGGEHHDHCFALLSMGQFLVFFDKAPSIETWHVQVEEYKVRAGKFAIMLGSEIAYRSVTTHFYMYIFGTVCLSDDHLVEKISGLVIVYEQDIFYFTFHIY